MHFICSYVCTQRGFIDTQRCFQYDRTGSLPSRCISRCRYWRGWKENRTHSRCSLLGVGGGQGTGQTTHPPTEPPTMSSFFFCVVRASFFVLPYLLRGEPPFLPLNPHPSAVVPSLFCPVLAKDAGRALVDSAVRGKLWAAAGVHPGEARAREAVRGRGRRRGAAVHVLPCRARAAAVARASVLCVGTYLSGVWVRCSNLFIVDLYCMYLIGWLDFASDRYYTRGKFSAVIKKNKSMS